MLFTHIIKPTHNCNLNCRYCFNEDSKVPVMSKITLERVIDQTFQYGSRQCNSANDEVIINFVWHGGEPMLAGIDFYKTAVELQRKFNRGIKYFNSIQTNATLINNDWIRFFREKDFNISISIDGPQFIHDAIRVNANNKGTFSEVLQKINMVKESGISLGVCIVLSRKTLGYEKEVFDFFVNLHLPIEIIPIFDSGNASLNKDSLMLKPEEYFAIWSKLFEHWGGC